MAPDHAPDLARAMLVPGDRRPLGEQFRGWLSPGPQTIRRSSALLAAFVLHASGLVLGFFRMPATWVTPPGAEQVESVAVTLIRLEAPGLQPSADTRSSSQSEVPEPPRPPEPRPEPKQPASDPTAAAQTLPSELPPEPVGEATAPPTVAEEATRSEASAASTASASLERAQSPRPLDPFESYLLEIQTLLEREKTYPVRARVRRQQGIVFVYFVIDREGALLAHRIERSSGHALLDRAVEELIERVTPLPRPPLDDRRERIELVVPVQFSLRRGAS